MNHGNHVGADGIHLGVKFAADYAVAEIDQAGARVALDFAASVFQILQNDDARGLFDFCAMPVARSKTEVMPFSDS